MMKTSTFMRSYVFAAAILMSSTVVAQERAKFEISPSVDIVSKYVWRGMNQTGAAIQPALTASYGGFSLGVWGSTEFATILDSKEFDITLGYQTGGFSIAVTDYWWEGEGHKYGHYSKSHWFEASLGYSLGESFPLSFSWNTIFAGGHGDKNADGDRSFSTYISAANDFHVKGIDVNASIGFNPWESMYDEDFNVMSVGLKASKDIKVTDSFSLPLFAEVIVSPAQDNVFLIVGMSF